VFDRHPQFVRIHRHTQHRSGLGGLTLNCSPASANGQIRSLFHATPDRATLRRTRIVRLGESVNGNHYEVYRATNGEFGPLRARNT
jgi:hypothetical protein